MSSAAGHGLLHGALYQSAAAENLEKTCVRFTGNSLHRMRIAAEADNLARTRPKQLLASKFLENRLAASESKSSSQGRRTAVSMVYDAVLTTDPSSEISRKFKLDQQSELQISTDGFTDGSPLCVNIQVTNNGGPLVLHWGIIRKNRKYWSLPSHRPDATKVYKNKALRTPFASSGSNSSLKLELHDPDIEAIEFVIVDESLNKWFKNNGQNFHIEALGNDNGRPLTSVKRSPSVYLPEDLVQIHAYLRWERNGRQNYTQSKEKEEYEAAQAELLEEIARGISVEELRAKLTKDPKDGHAQKDESNIVANGLQNAEREIPNDLIQVHAYVRWEKAGKPNYSQEEQLMEFEEARKDLQLELEKGLPLEEIRNKIMKGDIQAKVSKQLQHKKYFTRERIQRKRRDISQLINKHALKLTEQPPAPKVESALELFAETKIEEDGGYVINKQIYKLGKIEVLTMVTDAHGKKKVYVAADQSWPLVLHWGLSRNLGEWMAPPSSTLSSNSIIVDNSCETPFTKRVSADPPYEVEAVEIEIDGDNFEGMPFVIHDNGSWIKNHGNDFYVDFVPKSLPKVAGEEKDIAKVLLDRIAELESEAQKSFMHRFNIASDLMKMAEDAGVLGFVGILVWMRFMATRQLVWNKNYNVKPREISKTQDRLTDLLQSTYERFPQYREILRLIMSAVGRGGEGDVGQRIRDEILVIQRNNGCKGGMMEEWHQKLHNNTSPDDVVICQALLDYIKNDFDVNAYWRTLNSNGITKERLLSYDRAIHSEPSFRRDQKDGLLRDLGNYMRTLKAVHSGADLESAIASCLGYKSEGEGFMVGVSINPVKGLPSGFPELLRFILDHVEDKEVEPLLEGLLEAREELRPLLLEPCERLKDLIFLDIALDSTVRTATERGYEELHNASPEKIMYFISLVLENLAISTDDNEDLIYCLKGWNLAMEMLGCKDDQWALFAKSSLDRTRLTLSKKSEFYAQILQPSAEYLGSMLGAEKWAVDIFTEEIIRAGSAASLSALLNRLDPTLRKVANLGSWQIISPVEVSGYIAVVDELLAVQDKSYERPTILVAKSVKGEEEIPDGTVAVLTPDMPDVLSHVSVRARNGKVCFATCFDPDILIHLQSKEGQVFHLKPTSSDITYHEIKERQICKGNANLKEDQSTPPLTLVKKHFMGRYAVSAQEFNNDLVGAKARNIAYLEGKVPSWIGVPTSVALPFGVFEKVLSDDCNKYIYLPVTVTSCPYFAIRVKCSSGKFVEDEIQSLKVRLDAGEFGVLGDIRRTILQLTAPPLLVLELRERMKESGMPWPGDEGEKRWEQAWMAIKKVWASKWNERAYFSTKKVKIDHDYLCMAVLVQEIIGADYAFVIHTTNPSSGDSSEIYAEVVKGLGETLVGAYPGRALSFICKKSNLDSPMILGYPSKPVGLFIRPSLIFRSDSNGEDLEGYAGAGLYDSVPMDEEEERVLDYSSDPLITDANFWKSTLRSIARAGKAIEDLYGSPQDIEGVVKDGKITVVQTRPQM